VGWPGPGRPLRAGASPWPAQVGGGAASSATAIQVAPQLASRGRRGARASPRAGARPGAPDRDVGLGRGATPGRTSP
jgi:hypothetical protein